MVALKRACFFHDFSFFVDDCFTTGHIDDGGTTIISWPTIILLILVLFLVVKVSVLPLFLLIDPINYRLLAKPILHRSFLNLRRQRFLLRWLDRTVDWGQDHIDVVQIDRRRSRLNTPTGHNVVYNEVRTCCGVACWRQTVVSLRFPLLFIQIRRVGRAIFTLTNNNKAHSHTHTHMWFG